MIFKENIKRRKEFGALLRKQREQYGYTVRDVANITAIPFGVYASIERGQKAKIRMSALYSISNIFGLHIDDLCLACDRIPEDAFYKIIRHPELIEIIRKWSK